MKRGDTRCVKATGAPVTVLAHSKQDFVLVRKGNHQWTYPARDLGDCPEPEGQVCAI